MSLVRAQRSQRHVRYVLLVNGPNKLNLLSWLLNYLCIKYSAQHQTFKKQQQYLDAQIFNLPTALPLAATPILSY